MDLNSDSGLIHSSHRDTVAVAVCASVGGAGLVAAMIYVLVVYRRRKRGLVGGQDTLPRPFDAIVPAPSVTVSHAPAGSRTGMSTSTPLRPNVNGSPPVLDISSRNDSEGGSRGGHGNGWDNVFPPGRKPSRSRTVPALVPASQPQPGAGTSRGTRTPRHYPSDSSMHSGPDRSRAPTGARAQPNPQPQPHTQSGSPTHLLQSNPPLPVRTQPDQPPVASTSRSAAVQERRSAKRALYISRSASDMHRAASSIPRYRTHNHGPHSSSPRYAHPNHTPDLDAEMVTHPAGHLRHYYSASPIAYIQPHLEHDAGGGIIVQHRDAGIMHELPPPYHKLVKSDEGVYR
ncbi:hypothetical protein BS17DRAFT_785867 [Gyrodon lividus]|nr:hypothetical protein BS17DRAFT_785867 [Gyrodon lividus]